jgi:metal-responsive CopG/Arc/MetJ family transcriptional regulator
MKMQRFATKLPADLTRTLDRVCRSLGLRKNFVIETALREKIEDLLDAADLTEAISEATGFHPWEKVKSEAHKGKR